MSFLKKSYRVVRSVLLTVVLTVITLYVGLYVVISIPAVQNAIKGKAEKELSALMNSRLTIEGLSILPFNEVRISGIDLYTPEGKKCIHIDKLGAGISIYRLLRDQRIILTYAELIGLDGHVWQAHENGPLNIQFLIDAFKPKEKNKPPTLFDLRLYNVVIRKSAVSFDRLWRPRTSPDRIDFNHLHIKDLKADITVPRLSNYDYKVDVRRLAFMEQSGLDIQSISLLAHITPQSVSVKNLRIKLPGTELTPSDISLKFKSFSDIKHSLENGSHSLALVDNTVSLPDFACFFPPLSELKSHFRLSVVANGNLKNLNVDTFSLSSADGSFSIDSNLKATGLTDSVAKKVEIEQLSIHAESAFADKISKSLDKPVVSEIFSRTGDVNLDLKGSYSLSTGDAQTRFLLETASGTLSGEAHGYVKPHESVNMSVELAGEDIDMATISGSDRFGLLSLTLNTEASMRSGTDLVKSLSGTADLNIGYLQMHGHELTDINLHAEKKTNNVTASVISTNHPADLDIEIGATLDRLTPSFTLDANIRRFETSTLGLSSGPDYLIKGHISSEVSGRSIDDLNGYLKVTNAHLVDRTNTKSVSLKFAELKSSLESENRFLSFYSDWGNGYLNGVYNFSTIWPCVKNILHQAVPAVMPVSGHNHQSLEKIMAEYSLKLTPENPLLPFFNIPVQLGDELQLNGNIKGGEGTAVMKLKAPYIIQGGKKLITETEVNVTLDSRSPGSRVSVHTVLPVKNGTAAVDVNADAFNNNFNTLLHWDVHNDKGIRGDLSLTGYLSRDEFARTPSVKVVFNPSKFFINNAQWNIDRSVLDYTDKKIALDKLRVWHDGQFVKIDGVASPSATDKLTVSLNEIDLGYVFETLNINYVTFGGMATGVVEGSQLLSGRPQAATKSLFVKNLSYNGAVLGDADLSSHLDDDQMEITINADIRENGIRRALVDGGIWVTRDSLSFDLDADKVNVAFMKPFMAAFASEVGGRASGKLKLFGTFKDIDLVGRAKADSLALKLDFTNVTYHGHDSVILNSGRIEIPGFRIYDKYGNSAVLSGTLRHRYFHEPEFEFRLAEAKKLLCYDTNSRMNPDWYGTIYGNGSAVLRGRPGLVNLEVDMNTAPGSSFTFVLSDNQVAADYQFLTFSDRRKEELELEKSRLGHHFIAPKPTVEEESSPTVFNMTLRGTVRPDALMTLVMDPKAGDKITARGDGALQIGYNTESDEMTMFGKYTITEGNYNFSLQDLILKDFIIRSGSSISFNGDPLAALLDITAAYRVNTNLSDLDKSFANDKELNRTNVPVDAILKVDGDMRDPNISLDIELPTLTAEMARKVRSIISTEDMMNRQIIYLLALNKFYTPEYMGVSSNGGELASVASSTLSSQLQNMIGQLTNKFTVAPSFRSDKGDFSDMEVDVALSSRLLDNRLLINGNFGYRDRSTSQTTFIGDFDIEYLLNRSGNLRLKAYNHFNDQNYYLKSSLTTQGVGVVFRKDFDDLFSFLRRKPRKPKEPADSLRTDSVATKISTVRADEND